MCNKRSARYICQECGRDICEVCLEPHTWVCLHCHRRFKSKIPAPVVEAFSWSVPFKLSFLGFLMIFVGMVVVMATAVLSGVPANIGAIIFLGPIPIILSVMLVAFLTTLGVILFLTLCKRAK